MSATPGTTVEHLLLVCTSNLLAVDARERVVYNVLVFS